MSRPCKVFEMALNERVGWGRPGNAVTGRTRLAELPEELAAHAATCPRCLELLEVHEALGDALGERPVPRLSVGFEARLERRLAAERGRNLLWLRRLLPLYWAMAAVAGLLVLRAIGLPSAVSPLALGAALGSALLTLAGLSLPAYALIRAWLRLPLPPLPK